MFFHHKTIILAAFGVVAATQTAMAQVEPSAETFNANGTLVGVLETTMGQRGYKASHSANGQQYWWNANDGRCITTRADGTKVVHTEVVNATTCTAQASQQRKGWRSIFGL